MGGSVNMIDKTLKLAYWENSYLIKDKRIAAVQALSGTGACRVFAEFQKRFSPDSQIYIPVPTWSNHHNIWRDAHVPQRTFHYYHPETKGLDFASLMDDVKNAPSGSFFLLHACAHNPTSGSYRGTMERDLVPVQVTNHGINAGDVKKLQDAGIYTCNGLMMHTKKLPINMKGGNGKVAYIDTEGTFRPDRIVPIATRFGMDAGAVLDNIIYARAYTYEHQYNLLLGLAAKMSEEPFRLLIVDSVIALFRVDFTGRGELADRQQKLAQMLSRLIKIAEEFNVAVYMTNQVIADPGGGVFISDPKKPAGGHVLAHAATIRLMFRKGKGEQRVCKVFDAPNLPEAEAVFQITGGGITDAKD